MIDWIMEGIVKWLGSTVTALMDAVSGFFLSALGTDMIAMEEYFPFAEQAFTVLQYTAWALLFLITVWQLVRSFGGPLTDAESPLMLLARSALFAFLIAYAKPLFLFLLELAKAPYSALLDLPMGKEAFTFAGVDAMLKNALASLLASATAIGTLLILILEIALGWNYFKLLLETVERYVVVGVLCYTSPLAYAVGASKATMPIFRSWCRMVGSQLLLLVLNVWFLRGFNSAVGQYIGSGGALSNGQGNIFLWLFCALAFLKVAQRFDAYLASLGLNVAQTGSGIGMEILAATKLLGGFGRGVKAGAVPNRTPNPSGFAAKFRGNSFVRDAVTRGGERMGAGGGIGFVGRMVGKMAASGGATLNAASIASVACRPPSVSGRIDGAIADRSLGRFLPALSGLSLSGTQIRGGRIATTVMGANGAKTGVQCYNTALYERPRTPCREVSGADGSCWYLTASGANAAPFYRVTIPVTGSATGLFPNAPPDTVLREVEDGILEAATQTGTSLWYSSAAYEEPDAPHTVQTTADGLDWYAAEQPNRIPPFEGGTDAAAYDRGLLTSFLPGYSEPVLCVDAEDTAEGRFAVRHPDGSGMLFCDATRYRTPTGDYREYEDLNGGRWYGVRGRASVERVPVYENEVPLYDGENVRTVTVETVRYTGIPSAFGPPRHRILTETPEPKSIHSD